VILSKDEVAKLIESAHSPKYRTALSVAYGAGLRAGEVVALKTTDIDSERMTLRVEQGKGRLIQLLELAEGEISGLTMYVPPLGPKLFADFGLPMSLAEEGGGPSAVA
jgi:integrase